MLLLLLSILAPFSFVLVLVYLLAIYCRKRLPFYTAEIVETQLKGFRSCSWLSRFVVLVRLSLPGGGTRMSMFPVVISGGLEKAQVSSRYVELKQYYSIGKKLIFYYVPHVEWLFGFIPDSPGLPPGTIMMMVIGLLCGAGVAVLTLYGLGPFG